MFPSTKSSPYLLQKIFKFKIWGPNKMAPQVKALLAVKPDKLNPTFGTDMIEGKVSRTLSDNHTHAKNHTHIHTK